ncbi:MAG: hypothetical protein DMF53_11850 [Acidobacteria bacterium]|nr:MAG: hypothetical protein DMF53_11850 [Acidobacteriota bacterium]
MRLTTLRTVLVLLALASIARAQPQSPWTPFGPGGGSIFSLAVDPESSAKVYAVAGERDEDSALYRSTDGGTTWTALAGPWLSRVALDPSQPSTVYAGGYQRLLRSLDGGATWSDVSPPGLGEVTVLTAGPDGTAFAYDLRGGAAVLQRSTDHGGSWQAVAVETPGQLGAVAVDPADPLRVYYGTGTKVRRSLDGGVTWEDAGRPPVPPGLLTIGFLGAFPAAPPSPSTPSPLFLLGFEGITVYRSDDGAESWRPAAALPAPAGLSPSLAIDPGSLERWHVTSAGGSLNSVDGGHTWTLGSAGLPHPIAFPLGMSALAAAPSRPGLLYAGLDEWGIARSTSDGAGWRIGVETGLNGSIVRFLKLDPRQPDTAYLGLTSRGSRSFRSTDGGRTWQPFARAISQDGLLDLAADPAGPRTLYAATPAGLWKSGDDGGSWSQVSASGGIDQLAVLGPGSLLAAGCGASRSTNGGRTWKPVIPCFAGDNVARRVRSLWTGAQSPGPFYATFVLAGETGPGVSEVYRSWDGGVRWKRLSFPDRLDLLAVAPSDPKVLYAFNFSKTLFRSGDAGESWQPVYGPLPFDNRLTGGLAVDATDANTIYVATLQGVLVSRDGGRTLAPAAPPFEVEKKAASQLWTVRTRPGQVYAAASEGGLFVGRFE